MALWSRELRPRTPIANSDASRPGRLGAARSTIQDNWKRATTAGVNWPLPEELDDAALERLLYRRPLIKRVQSFVEPDYATVHQELKKKGVTLTLLWEEYKQSAGQAGYQYTAFCVRYAAWAGRLRRASGAACLPTR